MINDHHPAVAQIKFILSIFSLALALALFPVPAQSRPVQTLSHVDDQALNELFLALSQSSNQRDAEKITSNIWKVWLNPEPAELLAQMQDAMKARQQGDFGRAVRLLDEIIANYPNYAEAWNQRAILFFLVKDYSASISDMEEVLRLEPRHFGALAGQAVIYKRLGKDRLALSFILEALKIDPYLPQRVLFAQLLKPITRI